MSKKIAWQGELAESAADSLLSGEMIVSPTKVGYIIMVSNAQGLKRKFDAKERALGKPAVVLCGSMEQLKELAELNPEIEAYYQKHWDKDILMGCILPWKKSTLATLDPKVRELMTDTRDTSCFVIRFGTPSEQIVARNWTKGKHLTFASSANPSGKGNQGLVENIGPRIEEYADTIITANDYVESIQPNEDIASRYEQGVMVSMVDDAGKLIPQQHSERRISPCPTFIRKGLDQDKILAILASSFPSWNYRHGDYY